ncbi:MAG: BMP family ABC transporter substrate-binding protein [Clostridiales bacterium]|jgi:basic membrane protein A|nr:BMP family ABC transporter substrate-binding protein [Clostridiales bacterium]MBQ7627755.1 BMP family ABC transporter substrate-binding protein [Clostridiales bacterium]MBR6211382.1 BMP family ABC transporter substrate-binding protein [Clostridiales bacterium]
MRKLISIVLTAVMAVASVLAFTGCSGNAGGEAASSFKVGAIYINSKNDTAGYTYAHHKGITEAMKQCGLDPEKDLYIVDNVPEDDEKVSQAIDQLAGDGCNIIFGISFGYLNAFDEAAKKPEYADIVFSHATGYLSNDSNFNNYFGRIYQARYLAGIAAGYKSLALGNNEIGYVSAWGTEYAETCSGINAFALGAQSVNPDAHVNVYEIYTWGDQEKERQAAEILIDTYGCCVIAQHCDSAQPQIVANEKGVFGCGYNSDMTKEAPESHLCAPVWNWDVYYATAIKAAMEDHTTFMTKVGNYYEGLNAGLVGVSELSANNEPEAQEAIDLATDLMKSGNWDVFSGVKLSFSGEKGAVTMAQADADLVDNTGAVIVAAGGASVDDGVIQGSMNYYVEGVTQVNSAE